MAMAVGVILESSASAGGYRAGCARGLRGVGRRGASGRGRASPGIRGIVAVPGRDERRRLDAPRAAAPRFGSLLHDQLTIIMIHWLSWTPLTLQCFATPKTFHADQTV